MTVEILERISPERVRNDELKPSFPNKVIPVLERIWDSEPTVSVVLFPSSLAPVPTWSVFPSPRKESAETLSIIPLKTSVPIFDRESIFCTLSAPEKLDPYRYPVSRKSILVVALKTPVELFGNLLVDIIFAILFIVFPRISAIFAWAKSPTFRSL